MSWTDIFPVLDEEMLDAYRAGVTDGEREEFETHFGVSSFKDSVSSEERVNGSDMDREASLVGWTSKLLEAPQPSPLETEHLKLDYEAKAKPKPKHIVSATLFWKHVNGKDPDLPRPTREMLVDAKRMGLVKRFAPWDSYIAPLMLHTRAAVERHPDVTFRLYLANDLDFLIPELTALGWEICLMKSPSVRYCPGGFWRFLALEENALVTVIDTDRMNEVSDEINRTERMAAMGLGLWRVPGYYNSDLTKQVRYRELIVVHHHAPVPIRAIPDHQQPVVSRRTRASRKPPRHLHSRPELHPQPPRLKRLRQKSAAPAPHPHRPRRPTQNTGYQCRVDCESAFVGG